MKSAAKIVLALLMTSSATGASAATTVSSDNGWYDSAGLHTPSNVNTYTGENGNRLLNSFYAFDLTGMASASAITITFFANGIFQTETGSETVGLYDYAGSMNSLLNGTGGTAAFADLGSGKLLGQHTITGVSSSSMPLFTVSLSSDFVAQYNAALASADKRIALGAKLQTVTLGGAEDAMWSFSGLRPAAQLNITEGVPAVPEPATWAMMLFGIGMIGAAMRKKKPLGQGSSLLA
ncbi:MAG: PEPxxWA-CTERM sorting domain-containing protein [Alphaproteobacteria bacterium]|nr:PEPxxWA-CTERM sorting domain-containing protein [Alphaproteobacteria bacterium]